MKAAVTILCLLLAPVLLESCGEMFEKCKSSKFSIQEFMLQPVAPSGKPEEYTFVVSLDWKIVLSSRSTMGAYADCAPASSIETISHFELTSDRDLVLSDRTLLASGNLTSVIPYEYAESESIVDRKLFNYEELRFFPKFNVPSAQKHKFKFVITLSDGRQFDLETSEIELLPE